MKIRLTLHKELTLAEDDLEDHKEAILAQYNQYIAPEDQIKELADADPDILKDTVAELVEDDLNTFELYINETDVEVEILP